ncbi:hypothetical protein [Polyangium jinanense]|uniref:Transglycosylase SLT domain-containing protein n=1 Tax=Polyangium jinanense TaxID=2829994 RepID=A0A9X3WYL6_9BACT|nr:hypothetical protein [Polyangium jinanense]MDC3953046.1 hypothetical protein [Polyangium jinanense]MDC3980664.1 hypothetical protein [Polyangium jinanense]
MIRPIAVLVAGMLLSRPGMPKDEANRYARVLAEVAAARGFDPLIAVAIVHFETQWRPTLVSADGEDYGLGQVRARFAGACRDDADPVNAPSEACQRVKDSLLDGATNLRRMGGIIAANMEFCKVRTGSAKTERWLSGYQGYGDPERGRFCEPGEKTRIVLDYYKDLVAKLAPPPKPAPKPKATRPPPPDHGAEPTRAARPPSPDRGAKTQAAKKHETTKKAPRAKAGKAHATRPSQRKTR